MAGIGADIAEVIAELGTTVTILRSPTNIVEKMIYELDTSTSRPFFQEYVLNASFTYNSVVVSGDVVQFNGKSYLVTTINEDSFEDGVVEKVSVLYKSNFPTATSKLLIPTRTQNPTTFEITQGWSVRKSGPFGLLFQSDFFFLTDTDVSSGKDMGVRMSCIIPASYDTHVNDRVYINSTECYRVQDIEKFRFSGLHVLTLVDDERPAYVP